MARHNTNGTPKSARKLMRAARTLQRLEAFDTLPDSARIDLPVLRHLFPYSDREFWYLIERGVFPRPDPQIEGTRLRTWQVGRIRAYQRQMDMEAAE